MKPIISSSLATQPCTTYSSSPSDSDYSSSPSASDLVDLGRHDERVLLGDLLAARRLEVEVAGMLVGVAVQRAERAVAATSIFSATAGPAAAALRRSL